jgi:hypothetical protein
MNAARTTAQMATLAGLAIAFEGRVCAIRNARPQGISAGCLLED